MARDHRADLPFDADPGDGVPIAFGYGQPHSGVALVWDMFDVDGVMRGFRFAPGMDDAIEFAMFFDAIFFLHAGITKRLGGKASAAFRAAASQDAASARGGHASAEPIDVDVLPLGRLIRFLTHDKFSFTAVAVTIIRTDLRENNKKRTRPYAREKDPERRIFRKFES